MPVDPDLDHTWPDCVDLFSTSDATPEMRVLAALPSVGDYAMIAYLQVLGAAADGSRGNTLRAAYSILNNGTVIPVTLVSNTDSWGAADLTIATAVVGDEFQLTLTGLTATAVNWSVVWRLYQRAF